MNIAYTIYTYDKLLKIKIVRWSCYLQKINEWAENKEFILNSCK